MKYIYLVALLLSSILLGGCATKEVKPPIKKTKSIHLDLSKINYPSKIGDYELVEKKALASKDLGIMIRYVNPKAGQAFLDCYIYPQKKNSTLDTEYQDLMSALNFMLKKGELKHLKKIYEDTVMLDDTHKSKRTVFDMTNKNTAYYSVLYLTKLEDHYFKVRTSQPHKAAFLESDYEIKTVKELFSKIKFNK